jgi:hypothetical protein
MIATWILGSFFFVFIVCFVCFVWTRKIPDAAVVRQAGDEAGGPPGGESPGGDEKQQIAREYRIEVSPRVFVNYPFGIRVVFAGAGTISQENPAQGVESRHWSSSYYGWPAAAGEDSELIVKVGRLEFEAGEAKPRVQVRLECGKDSFATNGTTIDRTLRQDRDTVFSFWLNPLSAGGRSITVVLSQIVEERVDGKAKKVSHELATIPLDVSVTEFPIRLR